MRDGGGFVAFGATLVGEGGGSGVDGVGVGEFGEFGDERVELGVDGGDVLAVLGPLPCFAIDEVVADEPEDAFEATCDGGIECVAGAVGVAGSSGRDADPSVEDGVFVFGGVECGDEVGEVFVCAASPVEVVVGVYIRVDESGVA